MPTLTELQQREMDFWETCELEKPGPLTFPNLANKVHEAVMFISLFDMYRHLFRGRILELGSGQGWASCLVKKFVPSAHVTPTDIGPGAIQGVKEWEAFWNVRVDGRYACKASETKEATGSIDLVFAFAAAHHFVDHEPVLAELKRILKPGGTALYLSEPTSNAWMYPFMYWRANKQRSPEDIIVPSRFLKSAQAVGISVKMEFWPHTIKRGALSSMYYTLLKKLPVLTQLTLPCTANFILSV